jgi:hypothetical protein
LEVARKRAPPLTSIRATAAPQLFAQERNTETSTRRALAKIPPGARHGEDFRPDLPLRAAARISRLFWFCNMRLLTRCKQVSVQGAQHRKSGGRELRRHPDSIARWSKSTI